LGDSSLPAVAGMADGAGSELLSLLAKRSGQTGGTDVACVSLQLASTPADPVGRGAANQVIPAAVQAAGKGSISPIVPATAALVREASSTSGATGAGSEGSITGFPVNAQLTQPATSQRLTARVAAAVKPAGRVAQTTAGGGTLPADPSTSAGGSGLEFVRNGVQIKHTEPLRFADESQVDAQTARVVLEVPKGGAGKATLRARTAGQGWGDQPAGDVFAPTFSAVGGGLGQAVGSGSVVREPQVLDGAQLGGSAGEQIEAGMRLAARGPRHEVTVRLNPPELGSVHISLSSHGDEVYGRISVENPETMRQLHERVTALVGKLAEAGINLQRVDVVLSSHLGQASQGGGNPGGGSWGFADGHAGSGGQGAWRGDSWAGPGEDFHDLSAQVNAEELESLDVVRQWSARDGRLDVRM